VHGWPWLHHAVQALVAPLAGVVATLASSLADGLVGVVAGALVLGVVTVVQRLRRSSADAG
jgi:uncharacterized protein